MKTLLTIFTLVFTVMFSSTSFGEWTKIGSSGGGATTYYVDFERIRKHGGYVYWWDMTSYSKPSEQGNLSVQDYNQGDCKLLRFKNLSQTAFEQRMGGGINKTNNVPDKEWTYPRPNSVIETILTSVCSR